MTAATIDPAAAIQAAAEELLDSLRRLVADDDPGPDLFDKVSKLLRHARGKAGRATRAAAPSVTGGGNPRPVAGAPTAEPKAGPAAPSGVSPSNTATLKPTPASAGSTGESKPASSARAVTLSLPRTTSIAEQGSTKGATPMNQPAPSHPATRIRACRRAAVVAVLWVVLVVLLVLLVGCSSDSSTPVAATVSTTAAVRSNPNEVECVNVDRAYNAWKWEPTADPTWWLQRIRIKMVIDDGEDFAKAVEGYTDKPALSLNVAIARYNYELATLNAGLVATGSPDADTAARVVLGVNAINTAYTTFKNETCR